MESVGSSPYHIYCLTLKCIAPFSIGFDSKMWIVYKSEWNGMAGDLDIIRE